MHFYCEGDDKSAMFLSPEEGEELRELIEKSIDSKFTTHCNTVGLSPGNVINALRGRRKMTFKVLTQLLTGTPYQVSCQVDFSIQEKKRTKTAEDAHFMSLEDTLFLDQVENAPEEQLNETESSSTTEEKPSPRPNPQSSEPKQTASTFSSSEKPQEQPKTEPASPPVDDLDDSSTSFSPGANNPFGLT